LIAFLSIPHILIQADLMFRFGILFLYTTIWAFIGLFWIMDKHPMFNCKMPFWIRWPLVWALLNTIIVLFSYTIFQTLMVWTLIDGYSPFWFALEWAILGLIIDFITTKYCWEWKELLK
jgi:hypothetical protein